MAMAGFGILVGLIGLSLIGLMLAALISVAKATDDEMTQAGFNRYVWLAIIVVLPVIGSIAYFVVAHPKLQAGNGENRSVPAVVSK